jgi:BolA protein
MSRYQRIKSILETLPTLVLEIQDISHQHKVPKDAETHFQILIVSSLFEQKKTIDRHRCIQNLLQKEFAQGLHALSLSLYSPQEWEKGKASVSPPPPCKQGFDF